MNLVLVPTRTAKNYVQKLQIFGTAEFQTVRYKSTQEYVVLVLVRLRVLVQVAREALYYRSACALARGSTGILQRYYHLRVGVIRSLA
jgi:hypothetical protein